MSAQGFDLWLDRESWGVIVDALIEHRATATTRKAANLASTSDLRVDLTGKLIRQINFEAKVDTEPTDHRAQAERWLKVAANYFDGEWPSEVTQAAALIGLDHYLGAILDALLALGPRVVDMPTPRYRESDFETLTDE